jgi:hypothetical protein
MAAQLLSTAGRRQASEEKEFYLAPRRTTPMGKADRLLWKIALEPIRVKCYEQILAIRREMARKVAGHPLSPYIR